MLSPHLTQMLNERLERHAEAEARLAAADEAEAAAAAAAWAFDYDSGQRPASRLIRTALDAERVAMEWMRFFGFGDVVLTGAGADGGLDLVGSGVAGEVKMHGKPVGRPHLQKLHGAAPLATRRVFFALAGYTPQAVEYAGTVEMALFTFDFQGEPYPVNETALSLVNNRPQPVA